MEKKLSGSYEIIEKKNSNAQEKLKKSIIKDNNLEENFYCPNCNAILTSETIEKHIEICENPFVECFFCAELFPQSLINDHINEVHYKDKFQEKEKNKNFNKNINENIEIKPEKNKKKEENEENEEISNNMFDFFKKDPLLKEYLDKYDIWKSLNIDKSSYKKLSSSKKQEEIIEKKMSEILFKKKSANYNFQIRQQDLEKSEIFGKLIEEKEINSNEELEKFLLEEFLNTLPKNERELIEKQRNSNENANLLEIVNNDNNNNDFNNNDNDIEPEIDNNPIPEDNLFHRRSSIKIVGLDKGSLNSFPKCAYKETQDMNEEDKMCSICWTNFQVNVTIKILFCLHRFHVVCVDKWLVFNSSCPVCKLDMKNEIKKLN